MEVSFRKNLGKSYMCVEEQGQLLEEYELQMLERQKVPGLLQMQTVISEGKRRYLYDISGKQQIEDYFSGKKIGFETLQMFLISVWEMCVGLSEYMLREEGVCLEMRFIYVDLEDGNLRFTYLPFYEKNLLEAFEAYMEQILRKIDHQDKGAVELGYQIYQLCSCGNVDIGKLLETALRQRMPSEEEGKIKIDGCGDGSRKIEIGREKEIRKKKEKHKESDKKVPQIERTGTSEKTGKTWRMELERKKFQALEAVKKYLPGFSGVLAEIFDKTKRNQMSGERGGVAGFKKKQRRSSIFGRKKEEQAVSQAEACERDDLGSVQETLEAATCENAGISEHHTEILGVRQKEPRGKLVYQGKNQCEDIQIVAESFLIGKNSGQVDGVILAEGVSRLHAKISRQENRYFIEDLNSTNGTYLNDTALEYHQPQELKPGDRVCFGAEEYLFS